MKMNKIDLHELMRSRRLSALERVIKGKTARPASRAQNHPVSEVSMEVAPR